MRTIVIAAFASVMPTLSLAAQCDGLLALYTKYDPALTVFDRLSKAESSTLRAETAQSAVTNILLRKQMILDMLIAKDCDLPNPPEFPLLGLISSRNG